jgi:FkbM family methyltransferase
MKQKLLGTPIGRAAMCLREKAEMLRMAITCPESVGMLANDQLATKLITTICQPNKTFIDVGAHIGSVIAAVMHRDSSVKIIAVEAIPQKVERLRQKFPLVQLHGCAVGEATGELAFFIHTKQSGCSSLATPLDSDDASISKIIVPVKVLDELVTSSEVDAIKIDVEGAELGVLRGAVALLASSRPVIMFESGPEIEDGLGYTKQAMHQFLTLHGYVVLIPNRVAHNDNGLSETGFVESHLYPRRTTNYFAIPLERRIELRDRARAILGITPT